MRVTGKALGGGEGKQVRKKALPALLVGGLALLACTPVPATAPSSAAGQMATGPAPTHVPTVLYPTFTPSPSPLPIVPGAELTALASTPTSTPAGTATLAPYVPQVATPGPEPGPTMAPGVATPGG